MAVLAIDKNKPTALLAGVLPVMLFFFLDAYYLSLEEDFRNLYNLFIAKVKTGENNAQNDVYNLKPAQSGFLFRAQALGGKIFSLSILPFYASLIAALLIGRYLLVH
jgi:hypothetical protein